MYRIMECIVLCGAMRLQDAIQSLQSISAEDVEANFKEIFDLNHALSAKLGTFSAYL